MNAGQDERRAETGLARRQRVEGRRLACEWVKTTPQIGKHLIRHPRPNAASIGELAVIRIVAQEQRAEVGPRSFRVRPADNDELLAIERLGLAPEATVSGA